MARNSPPALTDSPAATEQRGSGEGEWGPGGGHSGALVLSKEMFASLAHRDFRYLWLGNLAAMFAMQMQQVARGWLIFDLTGSAVDLALVLLSFMGPFLLLSLVGGVMADRLRKKWVMVIAQGFNAVATAILATMIVTDHASLPVFIYFGIFNGTILAFSMPARQAIIPEIVGEKGLFNAMALSTASMNLSRILGPVLAGLVIGWVAAGDQSSTFGVGIVFFIIAAFYLVSVITLAALRHEGRSMMTGRHSVAGDMREAVTYIRKSPLLLGLLAMTFIPIVFGMPIQLLLPVYNTDVLGGGPSSLGWLFGGMGVGALIGSLILAGMGDVRHKGYILLGSCLVWALFMALFAMSTSLAVALPLMAFIGVASTAFMAMNWTLTQLLVAPEMRGRIMSIVMMSFGLMPIGVFPMAFIADAVGIDTALLLAAAALAVATVAVSILVPTIRRIDREVGTPGQIPGSEAYSHEAAPVEVSGRSDS